MLWQALCEGDRGVGVSRLQCISHKCLHHSWAVLAMSCRTISMIEGVRPGLCTSSRRGSSLQTCRSWGRVRQEQQPTLSEQGHEGLGSKGIWQHSTGLHPGQ